MPEVSSLPRRVAIEGERSSTPAADDSDEALMLAYASGRAVAFDTLYERHRSAVYRYLLRHCGNAATADELFQDVWMSVIRVRETWRPTAKFTTWLYTLARNRLVDHWRAHGQATFRPDRRRLTAASRRQASTKLWKSADS